MGQAGRPRRLWARLPWRVRRPGWGTSLVTLAGLVLSVPAAAEHGLKVHTAGLGFRVQCVGGTLAGVSTNAISRVFLTDPTDLVFFCGKTEFRAPYNKIDTVEYGQQASRRYAAAVLISGATPAASFPLPPRAARRASSPRIACCSSIVAAPWPSNRPNWAR